MAFCLFAVPLSSFVSVQAATPTNDQGTFVCASRGYSFKSIYDSSHAFCGKCNPAGPDAGQCYTYVVSITDPSHDNFQVPDSGTQPFDDRAKFICAANNKTFHSSGPITTDTGFDTTGIDCHFCAPAGGPDGGMCSDDTFFDLAGVAAQKSADATAETNPVCDPQTGLLVNPTGASQTVVCPPHSCDVRTYDAATKQSVCVKCSVKDTTTGSSNTACGLFRYINLAINFMAALIGIIVTGLLIVGGIQYTTAGSDFNNVAKAKKRIGTAVAALVGFGLLYALLQWLIPGGIL